MPVPYNYKEEEDDDDDDEFDGEDLDELLMCSYQKLHDDDHDNVVRHRYDDVRTGKERQGAEDDASEVEECEESIHFGEDEEDDEFKDEEDLEELLMCSYQKVVEDDNDDLLRRRYSNMLAAKEQEGTTEEDELDCAESIHFGDEDDDEVDGENLEELLMCSYQKIQDGGDDGLLRRRYGNALGAKEQEDSEEEDILRFSDELGNCPPAKTVMEEKEQQQRQQQQEDEFMHPDAQTNLDKLQQKQQQQQEHKKQEDIKVPRIHHRPASPTVLKHEQQDEEGAALSVLRSSMLSHVHLYLDDGSDDGVSELPTYDIINNHARGSDLVSRNNFASNNNIMEEEEGVDFDNLARRNLLSDLNLAESTEVDDDKAMGRHGIDASDTEDSHSNSMQSHSHASQHPIDCTTNVVSSITKSGSMDSVDSKKRSRRNERGLEQQQDETHVASKRSVTLDEEESIPEKNHEERSDPSHDHESGSDKGPLYASILARQQRLSQSQDGLPMKPKPPPVKAVMHPVNEQDVVSAMTGSSRDNQSNKFPEKPQNPQDGSTDASATGESPDVTPPSAGAGGDSITDSNKNSNGMGGINANNNKESGETSKHASKTEEQSAIGEDANGNNHSVGSEKRANNAKPNEAGNDAQMKSLTADDPNQPQLQGIASSGISPDDSPIAPIPSSTAKLPNKTISEGPSSANESTISKDYSMPSLPKRNISKKIKDFDFSQRTLIASNVTAPATTPTKQKGTFAPSHASSDNDVPPSSTSSSLQFSHDFIPTIHSTPPPTIIEDAAAPPSSPSALSADFSNSFCSSKRSNINDPLLSSMKPPPLMPLAQPTQHNGWNVPLGVHKVVCKLPGLPVTTLVHRRSSPVRAHGNELIIPPGSHVEILETRAHGDRVRGRICWEVEVEGPKKKKKKKGPMGLLKKHGKKHKAKSTEVQEVTGPKIVAKYEGWISIQWTKGNNGVGIEERRTEEDSGGGVRADESPGPWTKPVPLGVYRISSKFGLLLREAPERDSAISGKLNRGRFVEVMQTRVRLDGAVRARVIVPQSQNNKDGSEIGNQVGKSMVVSRDKVEKVAGDSAIDSLSQNAKNGDENGKQVDKSTSGWIDLLDAQSGTLGAKPVPLGAYVIVADEPGCEITEGGQLDSKVKGTLLPGSCMEVVATRMEEGVIRGLIASGGHVTLFVPSRAKDMIAMPVPLGTYQIIQDALMVSADIDSSSPFVRRLPLNANVDIVETHVEDRSTEGNRVRGRYVGSDSSSGGGGWITLFEVRRNCMKMYAHPKQRK
eukprot:CAMPEP_0183716172 /NCGR_PEP_ID=MMETSP0737-20130205/10166_1 /TAXON_ID=385413 /ORGANISM="Thalassiosira miniscula, Strain CCMP1093" /LENGTH=1275 /DNA_ID=CAMNT_0025945395 /DNA_START=232 /DNA_END=4059 /DNA_ORIENTATION=+